VRLPSRPAAAPLLRSYSLSGPPNATLYRISVKVEPTGAASTYLGTQARVGDVLEIAAPRGSFHLAPGSGPLVLASAGIGITPLLAMLHALADAGSERELWWLHGARNAREQPFGEEVRSLLARLPGARSHICYSQPGPHDQLGRHFDAHGRLTAEALDRLGVPRIGDFYLCGPPAFLADLRRGLLARQVPAGRLHTEVFGPEQAITPGLANGSVRQPHPPLGQAGSGPSVAFARSGLTVRWHPSFGSLLELAEACDVAVRWSCRTGVCHTCESRLLDGQVAYAPDPLERPAKGHVLPCCARPATDVVLDL
jgi:ferredoxin-NADP reductase